MVGKDARIAVYMMTNRKYGTLYTGVTNDLRRRIDPIQGEHEPERRCKLHETMISRRFRESQFSPTGFAPP